MGENKVKGYTVGKDEVQKVFDVMEEAYLLKLFRECNEEGKKRIMEYADMAKDKYKKGTIPNRAEIVRLFKEADGDNKEWIHSTIEVAYNEYKQDIAKCQKTRG